MNTERVSEIRLAATSRWAGDPSGSSTKAARPALVYGPRRSADVTQESGVRCGHDAVDDCEPGAIRLGVHPRAPDRVRVRRRATVRNGVRNATVRCYTPGRARTPRSTRTSTQWRRPARRRPRPCTHGPTYPRWPPSGPLPPRRHIRRPRSAAASLLVLRGAPAASDGDPLGCGIHCCCVDRVEQHRIEVGPCRMGVVENRDNSEDDSLVGQGAGRRPSTVSAFSCRADAAPPARGSRLRGPVQVVLFCATKESGDTFIE